MTPDEAPEFPIFPPAQLVGGGIVIGNNPNLSTDKDVVTFEMVIAIATDDEIVHGILPLLADIHLWNKIIADTQYNYDAEEAQQ